MENDTDLKQPDCPKQDALHDEAANHSSSHWPSRKTILIAAVIGVVTLATLSVVMYGHVFEPDNRDYQASLSESSFDDAVSDITAPTGLMSETSTEPFQETTQTNQTQEALHLKLDSCIGRVDQGFATVHAGQQIMKKELPAMGEGVRAIQDAIADLRLGNEVLSQRITEIQVKLKTIAQDVRGLKTPKKKKVVKKRKPVIKTPPFQIDAIDLWNDVIYVAVSHNGRAAFLKEGEQQSGWLVTQIDRLKGEVGFRGPADQIHSVTVGRQ
ncbi:hypothetical protein ACFL3U_05120 [Pseudomonadota bacterium]